MKLNAQQMRTIDQDDVVEAAKNLPRNPLYLILENIYDTYNIGGLFRLADGLAVEKIYICGKSEIPPNHKIKKASIGTYKVVPWEYKETAKEAIDELKNLNPAIQVVAVEQDDRGVPYTSIEYAFPVALLVGNETYGVLPETLNLVDDIAEIPMWGINKSLNVIVSAAIVCFHLAGKFKE
ncbi:MAG: TrmH family RNA methyltransferase [Patescibacteria group bacterium]